MAPGGLGLGRSRIGRRLLLALAAVAAPAAAAAAPTASAADLAQALQAAWNGRDLEAYLALWAFTTAEQRQEEATFAAARFESGHSELLVPGPPAAPAGASRIGLAARAVTIREPRGRIDHWVFVARRGPDGWAVAERQAAGQIDGLVHLQLHPQGYRADGLSLKLPDFEMRMERGTFFTATPELGPTMLVFVGEGRVALTPRPLREQQQLRQFGGRPELRDTVRSVFVRVHPADLHRVLQPVRFEVDPEAHRRLPAAQQLFERHAFRSFVLDAAVTGSPWWLLPSLGDAVVAFDTRRHGTLTYALNSSLPEDVTLFDRARGLQILLYPSEGRPTLYDEDEGREYEILSHEIDLRFDPARLTLEGQDRLRLRLRGPASTVQLRLHDSLQVRSVRSDEIGEHLFFRVRGQDTVMVALGALSGHAGELSITVRYGGTHSPEPLTSEVQFGPAGADVTAEGYTLEESLVYSNQTAWYPRPPVDSHAPALLRLDVPEQYRAVTGGERVAESVQDGRYRVEYRLERPGRYYSVVLARLHEVGRAEAAGVRLRAFGQPRTRGEAERLLGSAADVLRFLAAAFGPCPYPELNLVVVEGRTPGGHSPPGMVVLSIRPPFVREALREDPASFQDVPGFFFAHELAHQWWGQGVAGENYHERWLSEGMAQYAAALWTRHQHGEREFQEVLSRLGRWALRKSDEGPIHLGHRLGHIKGDPQVFRAVVYNKGAYVLHMLRRLTGPERFLNALRAFQDEFRYGKAGSDDLRRALEKEAGRPLAPYFEDWVYGTRLPVIEVDHRTSRQDQGYRTVVEVTARGLPGPVPLSISVTHDQGELTQVVELPPGGGTFVLDTPGRPRKVQVNADRALLARVNGR